MEDPNDAILGPILKEDINGLVEILETSKQWINKDVQDKQCLNAYNFIWGIKDSLEELDTDPDRNKKLSIISNILALPLIKLVETAMKENTVNSLEISKDAVEILFRIKPYLSDVTSRRYGGTLYRTASICSERLQSIRKGLISAELTAGYLTLNGFFASYMQT